MDSAEAGSSSKDKLEVDTRPLPSARVAAEDIGEFLTLGSSLAAFSCTVTDICCFSYAETSQYFLLGRYEFS